MTNSERFAKAHKLTKKAIKENSSLNYRVQFGFELAALYSEKMVELQGSEKQIKWAKDILVKIEESFNSENLNNHDYLNACNITKNDIKSALENIKKIESAKTIIDIRCSSAVELINTYKTIEITEEQLNKCREDERLMRRINKIKSGERSKESYIEITMEMINNSSRLAKIIYDKLMGEAK